uniref:Uncharacterized protein n=1 Tax=Leishmania guyanensis TaxID=5670 RepID=A0A1E1IWX6_LEIGU|nr:Hypothetical protein BN36_2333060 [Leishmania guyanensis]
MPFLFSVSLVLVLPSASYRFSRTSRISFSSSFASSCRSCWLQGRFSFLLDINLFVCLFYPFLSDTRGALCIFVFLPSLAGLF